MLTSRNSVKSNQESPLLRIPPEIRNRIWEYALGGKNFRQQPRGRKQMFVPMPRERVNASALLRTCRQIYAETALIPFAVNTFSVNDDYWPLRRVVKSLPKYQRSQITELRVELQSSELTEGSEPWWKCIFDTNRFSALPGLQCIRVCVFPSDDWETTIFSNCEARLRLCVESDLRSKGHDLVVEKMNTKYAVFEKK
jgi:hypothetical protein